MFKKSRTHLFFCTGTLTRIFFLAVLATPVSTFAAKQNIAVCSAYLMTARGFLNSSSDARDAIQILRQFRLTTLNQIVVDPGMDEVTADSVKTPRSTSEKLAKRIRAIEVGASTSDSTSPSGKDEEGIVKFRGALVLKGTANVNTFFELFDENLNNTQAMTTSVTSSLTSSLLFTFWGFVYALPPTVILAPLIMNGHFEPATLFSLLTAILYTQAPKYDYPKVVFKRRDLEFDRRWQQQKNFLLDQTVSKGWFYDSKDYELDSWVATKLSQQGHFLDAMTGLQMMSEANIPSLKNNRKFWVSIDRFVTKDPTNGEPTIVVFLRGSEHKPAFPKPVKQSALDEMRAGLRAPETVSNYP